MHGLADMDQIEDRNGRVRTVWKCECGRTGSGATPKAALTGFKRHVVTANRKDYYG